MRDLHEREADSEPLLRQNADEIRRSSEINETPLKPSEEDGSKNHSRASWFLWSLTFSAGVSGLLFGYDTGVISSTLISVGTSLSSRPLTTLDKSLITSSTSLFALFASLPSGLLADAFGRKKVIFIADVLFVVGALWQAFATTAWGMIGGRSVVGLAVGSASFVTPLYISELAPARIRGRMVIVQSLFITGGQVVAYIVGWLLSATPNGWRLMVGLGALPAIVQVTVMVGMPETPRWLVKRQKQARAREILRKVYGTQSQGEIENIIKDIEQELFEQEAIPYSAPTSTYPKSTLASKTRSLSAIFDALLSGGSCRALTIACLLQGAQQLCGFNSLMYFSATIFALIGFRSPTLTSLSIAIANFLFTLVAFYAIDRVGRRRILLGSLPVMIMGLILCAVGFNFLHLPASSRSMSSAIQSLSTSVWAIIVLVSLIVYVAGYALGLGNVPWQQSELFPLPVRSLGSSISTATNWGSNFIIGITFLPMMEFLSPVGTFTLYAAICAAAWLCIWCIYPETAGLGLEDVGRLLTHSWGVTESVRSFHERRRMKVLGGDATHGR